MNILKWIGGIFDRHSRMPWVRWGPETLVAAQAHLEGKDPRDYSVNDWYSLIDWLLQRYLPDGVIQTEAEFMVARAKLAGHVQANLAERSAQPDETAGINATRTKPVSRADIEVSPAVMRKANGFYEAMGIPTDLLSNAYDQYRELEAGRLNGSMQAEGKTASRGNCSVARALVDGKKYALSELLAA